MSRKPIPVKETRYQYAGEELNAWFEEAPLEFPRRDAIWSLATGDDGVIYIGLAGEHNRATAALAAFDPKTGKTRILCDVGELLGEPRKVGRMPHSKIHFAICPAGQYVWFGTHVSGAYGPGDMDEPIGHGPIADTITGYEGGRLLRYDTRTGETEQFGVVVPSEGIRSLHLSRDRRYCYGISYPKHRFFMRNLRTGETYISGRVGRRGGIDVFIDRSNKVWGTHDGHEGTKPGQFFYFDHESRRLIDVDAFLPRSSRRRMSFPVFGSHVLHMTPTPDQQALVSTYGESRIALFDPTNLSVYDWGSVWDKPPIAAPKHDHTSSSSDTQSTARAKPDFAWCPVFDRTGRTIESKQYDRFVWYGAERWEYEHNVRLCALAYDHSVPERIVKIRFGTPVVGKHPAGHWAASTAGRDGKIYFAERVRDPSRKGKRKFVMLRLTIFTPPKNLDPLVKA